MFLELLKKRRSIREFTEQPVEQEKTDLLIEAAARPRPEVSNPGEFVVATDREAIGDLARAKAHGPPFLKMRRWPSLSAVIPPGVTCGLKIVPSPP